MLYIRAAIMRSNALVAWFGVWKPCFHFARCQVHIAPAHLIDDGYDVRLVNDQ